MLVSGLIFTIAFENGTHEWWMFPPDADRQATCREVEKLIDQRNRIPGASFIIGKTCEVGMVYRLLCPM